MPVISTLGAMSSRGFGEFNQQAQGKYIEDYFSTYLYTGNGGSSQTISNGIGLSDTAGWNSFTATQVSDVEVWDVTTDSSGNFYTVGRANDGTGNSATVIKYNSTGVVQWQKRWYQSGWTPYGYGVTVDSSGNVFVCGAAYDGTRYNGIIIKYNSSGVIQWYRKMYAGQTYLRKVCLDTSGNIYCVGYVQPSSDYNIYVVKLDSSGAIVWERKLYEGASFGYGIGIDSSNNIYVTGFANDANRQYAILAKYDSSGAIQWQKKTYEATYSSSGTSVFVDSSNNVFVAGIAFDGTRTHATIQKFDTSGNRSWSRKYYQNTSYGYGVSVDSSGNSYLVGSINSNQQWFVSKYNSSGTIQWQRVLSYTTNSGVANKVASDTSGNIFIAGTFIEPTISNNVAIVSKILADGSTTSGQAYLIMNVGSGTDAIGGQTVGAGTALDQAQSTTTSTTGATDATGTLTTATYTQSAVTGAEGLVWIKGRNSASQSTGHVLADTVRGRGSYLQTQNTTQAVISPAGYDLQSFNASGFTVGSPNNFSLVNSSVNYATWTWRTTPKFFDVVTYTGDGSANRQINHNLGSVPGMIIVKCTSTAPNNWAVYHRGLNNGVNPQNYAIYLNLTNAAGGGRWASTAPTATQFSVNNDNSVNTNGDTYVAYLFAHNAGGFGADGSQNVISCGFSSVSSPQSVTLGWEPQWVLIKRTDSIEDWYMFDTMRGLTSVLGDDLMLRPNLAAAESAAAVCSINSTGFIINNPGSYIYMAIRRGPMRTPTSGTSVFNPQIYTGDYNTTTPLTGMNPATDMWWNGARAINTTFYDVDRLRGWTYLETGNTAAEIASPTWSQTTQTSLTPSAAWWGSSQSQVNYFFNRAPGFFDVVCYTGTGVATTQTHNLGVVPELMIVKARNTGTSWPVYSTGLTSAAYGIYLNSDAAQLSSNGFWNSTAPTSTVFSIGAGSGTNGTGTTYVAYLFASCPGVSKVGNYTGTGATQTISCGFTGGARFVLIKRTDSTGDWYVWDSARGMVAGTDPYKLVNTNNTETNTNSVYTTTGGFQIVSTAAGINASGGKYLFFAVS